MVTNVSKAFKAVGFIDANTLVNCRMSTSIVAVRLSSRKTVARLKVRMSTHTLAHNPNAWIHRAQSFHSVLPLSLATQSCRLKPKQPDKADRAEWIASQVRHSEAFKLMNRWAFKIDEVWSAARDWSVCFASLAWQKEKPAAAQAKVGLDLEHARWREFKADFVAEVRAFRTHSIHLRILGEVGAISMKFREKEGERNKESKQSTSVLLISSFSTSIWRRRNTKTKFDGNACSRRQYQLFQFEQEAARREILKRIRSDKRNGSGLGALFLCCLFNSFLGFLLSSLLDSLLGSPLGALSLQKTHCQ